MTPLRWLLLTGLAGAGACGKGAPDTGKPSDAPQMGAMPMGNMAMDTKSMPMIGMMQAHMDSMTRMSPEQIRATMNAHQSMTSQMLDAMGADMMAMHMAPEVRGQLLATRSGEISPTCRGFPARHSSREWKHTRSGCGG
jgi:hypothetical protein